MRKKRKDPGYNPPATTPKPNIGPVGQSPVKQPDELVLLVVQYLHELANPAPDPIMRAEYRRRMALAVGMEDPAVTLRRWHQRPSPQR